MIGVAGIAAAVIVAVVGLIAYSQLRRSSGAYFNSNGVDIFYFERGSGEPVILVHGFAANGDTNFRNPGTVSALAKKYRVITMDARGHGRSGKPHARDEYGVEAVNDIKRLMDHLEIDRAHLIGYSMGALLAIKFMTLYPERLITVAPCGNGWHIDGDPQVEMARRLAADLVAGRGYGALFELVTPLNHPINPLLQATLHFFMRVVNDSQALGAMVDGWQDFRLTADEIKPITVPSLCVIGEYDAFRRGAERLAATKPNHEIVFLENRNHLNAFLGSFAQHLEAFLAKHPATDAVATAVS